MKMGLRKVKLEIEHASGDKERFSVSHPIAIAIIDRVLQSGWPWCSVSVNSQQITGKTDPCCTNSFRAKSGLTVIL